LKTVMSRGRFCWQRTTGYNELLAEVIISLLCC